MITAGLALLMLAHPMMARAAPFAGMVMDMRDGRILYSDNADTRLHPASLTKLMTLYICFEEIRRGALTLDTPITVSAHAASQPPSKLGLHPGQRIALRYLIRAAAVKSANDAASAIGDAIGGDEASFAVLMNKTANALGMRESTFKNENGLTRSGHMSSAHDMAILARHMFFDFPEYYNIFSRTSTDAGVATVYSTNRKFLDGYPGAEGMKTGFTWASGFNLVGVARHGNKRLIGVVFGETSTNARNARVEKLFDIYFKQVPETVAVKPPAKPNLDFLAPQLVASADRKSQLMTPGSTVRLATVVKTSPRPAARPDLIAAAQAATAMQVATALGDAQPDTPAAVVAAPVGGGSDIAPASLTLTPQPRPADLLDTVANADPEDPAASKAPLDVPRTVADNDGEALDDDPVTAASTDAQVAAIRPQPAVENIQTTSSSQAQVGPAPVAQGGAATSAPAAKPRPEILYASVGPSEAAEPVSKPEVISRMSTSGGHDWAITLGRYPSRSAAERILLRTALAESGALSDSLRKVVQHPTGYDANFVGLSQDQADLACRQLQARNVQCFALSP